MYVYFPLEKPCSRSVNKFLSKRRFCSIFIGRITDIFRYLSQNEDVIFEDGLLNFVEKQTKHSYVARLQRCLLIFRSNFFVDSPNPPKSVQNTIATLGNNIDCRDNRFVYGYVTLP